MSGRATRGRVNAPAGTPRQALDLLEDRLSRSSDWASVRSAFCDHLAGRFLDDLVAGEVKRMGEDPLHQVPYRGGQAHWTLIDTDDFEYSVRMLVRFPAAPRPVKWLGMRQIVGVKGPGLLTVLKLAVPRHLDVASFVPGVAVEEVAMVSGAHGDVILAESPHELLDIHEVASAVVIEVLTYRRDDTGPCWTFDEELRSLYAEQSSLTVSRFKNVLELTHAAGASVPNDIYELMLGQERSDVALLALRSMLLSGHPDAFDALHRAMESGSAERSRGALRLFDAMTATISDA